MVGLLPSDLRLFIHSGILLHRITYDHNASVRERALQCLRAFLFSSQLFSVAVDEIDVFLFHLSAFPEAFPFVDHVICKVCYP